MKIIDVLIKELHLNTAEPQIAAAMKHNGLAELRFSYEHHHNTKVQHYDNTYVLVRRHDTSLSLYLYSQKGQRIHGHIDANLKTEILNWLVEESELDYTIVNDHCIQTTVVENYHSKF